MAEFVIKASDHPNGHPTYKDLENHASHGACDGFGRLMERYLQGCDECGRIYAGIKLANQVAAQGTAIVNIPGQKTPPIE